ncbi:MAG TPA: flagellar basal body P-ring formation chaperone FlgA [Planctomycetota bacterium]|nr:flagellar basal body P-ring formation chaperone FlgA [Planctomycetota bacterium]
MIHAVLLTLALGAHGGGEKDRPAPRGDEAAAPIVEVRCRSQALVRGADVRLRDVAEVLCSDQRLAERLADLSFGRRPTRGFNRVLPQSGIRAQLAAEGLLPDQVKITGAAETIVQSVHATVAPQELIDVAEPILRAAIAAEGGHDVEFELLGKPMPLDVPPGRRSFDLRGRLRGDTVHPTSAIVEVAVVVDDEEVKVVPLSYRLRRYGPALVVTEPVRRETPLGAHVLEARRIELAPGAETLHVADLASVQGMVAARDLRRGQILRLSDLAAPAVVRPKDPVVVVLGRGAVQVTCRGIALGSAPAGGRVDVVTSSGKMLQGIAHGNGIVVVGGMLPGLAAQAHGSAPLAGGAR